MFKVNNKVTRTTAMASCSSVSIVNFEQVNAGWEADNPEENIWNKVKTSSKI